MKRELGVLTLVAIVSAGAVFATPYWVAYEGNDFPENEGWTRVFSADGAVRALNSGNLILDSRASAQIVDFYNLERLVDPGPGETFVMRWRMRVDDIPAGFPYDPVVGVFSDNYRAAAFQIGVDRIQSTFEPGVAASFSPGAFHDFEFISTDMLSYDLYADGQLLLNGSFQEVFNASRVGWGDGIQGGRSLVSWDRFEFGVAPEPGTGALLATGLIIVFYIVSQRRLI